MISENYECYHSSSKYAYITIRSQNNYIKYTYSSDSIHISKIVIPFRNIDRYLIQALNVTIQKVHSKCNQLYKIEI